MTRVVLDASAVTAVLRSEPGSENVIPLLRGALISAVNLAEVFCTARARHSNPTYDEAAVQLMQLVAVPFDEQQASAVASIYQSTIGGTLGLADRACIALGLTRGLPVLTSDREWLKFETGVEVRLFREPPKKKIK